MGAWNRGLFDNDSALDAVGNMFDRLGIQQYLEDADGEDIEESGEERDARHRVALDERLPSFGLDGIGAYETVILAAMAMRLGARLPDGLRSAARERLPAASEEEHYFFDEARGEVAAALSKYRDGSPWPFAQKGLFETMAEKAGMGLINEPPKGPR